MSNSIITPAIVSQVVKIIESKSVFKRGAIFCEIQDDGNHLLISISVDGLQEIENFPTFKNLGRLVNCLIPGRRGDYSWMVVFTKKGKVIDSYFGGDLNCPESGL